MASAVAAAVLVLDQVTKSLVLAAIDADEAIDLPLGVRLVRRFNTGMSFSLGRGSQSLKITVFVFGLLLLLVARRELRRADDDPSAPKGLAIVAFGLVVGGAFGNLADRAFRGGKGFGAGAVIDFIDVGWWPVFNVADSALVIGCLALVLWSVTAGSTDAPERGQPDAGNEQP